MASLKPRLGNGKINLRELSKDMFFKNVVTSRLSQGNVENFPFNESRFRVISKKNNLANVGKGILYWMKRDCRVEDNWAMCYSQQLALKNKLPLFVCFTIFEQHYLCPTKRQQRFLLTGLEQLAENLKGLDINFYLLNVSPKSLAKIVNKNKLGAVICDLNTLRTPREWEKDFMDNLDCDIPFVQVDAHNVVPLWKSSDKQEIMARTIRPKITKVLSEFLTGFPKISKHPYKGTLNVPSEYSVDFKDAPASIKTVWDVDEVIDVKAGCDEALDTLHSFLCDRLQNYGIKSNDPTADATSNLSFWIHFGHISAQRIALEVKSLESLYKDQVDKYLEELIVRKELADNFCFYNDNYDRVKGAAKWAQETLSHHKKDKRLYVYNRDQLEKGLTHDSIWNAAQQQLLREGKVHGYMRMYWCKKILEWTTSPEQALEFAIWLNDTFALDGTDSNGYVGVMWSICGVHDQGWKEREVFGKIRYMVDYSLRKKFDMDVYCARYGTLTECITGKRPIKRKR
ncbi:deoxyribodipyrimidine photo-lyase-like [Cylas formicarius]|uniref:deoxyribodipyrimidine photo-lyase-like n=1 Tax=Cylas formicarius TaxID=197179 RepID=UPI0029584634|nr:deoxyribodipyrimidine photo-lyase-like [Cylas formicarius]